MKWHLKQRNASVGQKFLTKKKGEPSIKEQEANLKRSFLENAKKSEIHKKIMENFSDAELIDIKIGEHIHLHNMKSDYISSHTRQSVVGK